MLTHKGEAVPEGGILTDKLGRSWSYVRVIGATKKTPGILTVKRVIGGHVQSEETHLALAMFNSDYAVK